MPLALTIVQLITAAEPGLVELITVLRKKDGSVSVIQYLDEADAKTADNLKQNMDWFAAHPPTKKE